MVKVETLLKQQRYHLIFLVLLVIIAYANSLTATFISDDIPTIAQNPQIKDFSYVTQHGIFFIQPLMFFLIYKVFGAVPAVFRSIHILFHIGTVITLYLLLTHMWNRKVALIASSIFAVHPLLTEPVTWISGGHYVRYGFCFLLSFYFYIKSHNNLKWYIASIAAFLIALEATPLALAMGPVLVLYNFVQKAKLNDYYKTAPYFIFSGLYFLLMFTSISSRVEYLGRVEYAAKEVYNFNPLLLIPIALTNYLNLVLFPLKLSFYYTEIYGYLSVFLRSIVLLIFLGIIGYFYRLNKLIFFWLAFFIIALGVVIAPVQITSASVGERYAYLASIGIIIPISYLIYRLSKKHLYASLLIVSLILVLFTARTILRNNDWRTYENFWTSALRNSPNSYQAHSNVGNIAFSKGDYETAIMEFQKTIAIVPEIPEAHYNLATAYYEAGYYPEALEEFQRTIALNPNFPQAYLNISAIYYIQKDYKKSEEYTLKTLEFSPNDPNILSNLGVVYLGQGLKTKAKETFEKVLQIDPNHAKAKAGLADSLK